MDSAKFLGLLQEAQEGTSYRERSGLPESRDIVSTLISSPKDFLSEYVKVLLSGKLLG